MELVDDGAKAGTPSVFVKLETTHRLDASGSRSAGEMYLKAAQTGDATVRLMDGAVRRTAAAERTLPVAEFAHAVLDEGEGCADHIARPK